MLQTDLPRLISFHILYSPCQPHLDVRLSDVYPKVRCMPDAQDGSLPESQTVCQIDFGCVLSSSVVIPNVVGGRGIGSDRAQQRC
jgi:hypothetical protein